MRSKRGTPNWLASAREERASQKRDGFELIERETDNRR